MSLRSSVLGTTLVAMAATSVAAATTAAAAENATPSASGPTQTVQLELAPRDQAGLRELAAEAKDLPSATREARLAQVLPGTARAGDVASRAKALGFKITATTATSVTLTGPASLVTASFGSARKQDPTSHVGHALPTMPTSLRGLVLVATGGDETRISRRPINLERPSSVSPDALTQADFRRLYQIPGVSAAPSSSSPGIATIQFSNWDSSDLTTYASETGVYGSTSYDPVASGTYTAITVDSGATGTDGADEVALDQSALATAAPQLNQFAYFAPNTASGQADALNAMVANAHSEKLIAVSTSWGMCEDGYFDQQGNLDTGLLQTDLNAIYAATAAGLTIFAASGDNGNTDCTDSLGNPLAFRAVDTPGSFPYVISTGGTSVTKVSGSNGTTYTQSAWGGSGGGYSELFCASTAQARVLPSTAPGCETGSGKARGVPDVAMDADPETGLTIYPGGSAATFGGTSLSAPLAAGAFASTMFSAGQPAGSRDVTTWLYSASATAGFTDVNTGNNGYAARTGWDPVTGLGAPHWTKLQARALMSPSSLASGAQLVSANGLFRAAMQGDGNFVVYGPHGALWSSHTAGNPGATLSVQFDGNLVIYRNGAIWNTHTSGHPGGTVLVMQDTGTLVLQQGGKPLWQVTDTLATPGLLVPGQQIIAANGDRAAMQGDGNFVVYGLRGALWSSRTSGNPGATLSLQSDGNLVIYRNGKAIWNTHTSGTGAQNRLVIQGDGNLVLYNSIRAVWNTHTTG